MSLENLGPFVTFSPALASIPHIHQFLGEEVRFSLPPWPSREAVAVGWGRKPSFHWAARYARWHGIGCLSLEDGFLRSVGMGRQEPPLSLVVDDLGIYYDAGGPSRLECQIAECNLDVEGKQRVDGIVAGWRQGRLSKYNHARDAEGGLPEHYVLVVDQTFGDASIRFGQANEHSFRHMLEAALDEHPDATVVLKVHPEVFAGRKRGHFEHLSSGQAGRVMVLGQDIHAPSLLERSEAIYTVTSQMGFEGLLWGKPVRTFGMPFYAGWGLTRDDLPAPDRRKSVAFSSLVHAVLVDYPRYVDPETGQRCEVERVMSYLAFQRRMRQRFPEEVHAIGIGRLRRPIAQAFFNGSHLNYHAREEALPPGATVAVWGGDEVADLPEGRQRVCLEDGFLRSVGLGAELVQPLSLAMDRRGIYYDATQPSELENILQTRVFEETLLARAAQFRQRIVAAGLTKYNVGRGGWCRPEGVAQVILVPGQVETDASIRFGAPGIKTNLGLLQAVRADNLGAYVVYKPHPDVLAGLRREGEGEAEALRYCDAMVTDVSMDVMLDQVDEVHVLTSLAGFEALLRGRRVVTYGQPFYAGWGLTFDHAPVERRTRQLELDELVAGVLLLYPTYVSRVTKQFTSAEQALDELLAWRVEESMPQHLVLRVGRWIKRAVIGRHNRLLGR